jgi:hypothetical protein
MPATTTRSIAAQPRTHHKGEKREAYLRAASEHGWGQAQTSGCGGMSLLREQDGHLRCRRLRVCHDHHRAQLSRGIPPRREPLR